jgi:WD40 repeat protein
MSADGKRCLTAHANSTAFHLVEVPSLKTVQTFTGHVRGLVCVELSPDGALAASASVDNTVRLWDVKTGKERRRLPAFGGYPRALAFSPDGELLLVGAAGNATGPLVFLFDVKTGVRLRSFKGHTSQVGKVVFLPGGKEVFSAASDGTLCVHEVKSGQELRRMRHGSTIHDAALSPDGKLAASAGFADRLVKVWDVRKGELLEALDGHAGAVLGVGFAPDGKRLLSGDSVCCVRLWRVGR